MAVSTDIYGLDYESSSLADLADVGSYRYSNDPSTFILMFAVAKNDGEPLVWDSQDPFSIESEDAVEMLRMAIESKAVIRAFNAQMEVAMSRYVLTRQLGLPEPDLSVWRCTMAMCNRAALRSNLGDAITDLGLPEEKLSVGRQLIDIFSKRHKETVLYPPEGAKDPDTIKELKSGKLTAGRKPKNRKTGSPVHDEEILWDWLVKVDGNLITVREAWKLMLLYVRRDVISERAIANKLHKFELTGDELASWQFDLRMNYKGVPVNRDALKHAQKLVERYSEREINRFQNLCGLKPSQTAKLLPWLKERGYKGDNLQADTIEEELKDTSHMTSDGAVILKMRSLLSFSALAKIPSMLGTVCDDGYVRGTTLWHGARTGRATGKLVQPQNMKKATIKDSEVAYDLIQSGCSVEDIAISWDSPLEVISSCCRHFLQPHEGLLLDADYTGVEARIGPWLCGETGKLQSIIDGLDQYKVMASEVAFDIPYDKVTKAQREIGKPIELQCIYGTGGKGLRNSLRSKGIEKTLKECNEIVRKFRAKFPGYPETWREMEDAAKAAIRDGTVTTVCNGRMRFGRLRRAGIVYLVMVLPGGRHIHYPHPQIKRKWTAYDEEEMELDEWKREQKGYWGDSISFYGKDQKNSLWGRRATWGSRLFENACQAIGADLLNYGCLQAEAEGYDIRMIIHDQILGLDNGLSLEGFIEAFCRKQPWAHDFPLEASGARHPFYLKD